MFLDVLPLPPDEPLGEPVDKIVNSSNTQILLIASLIVLAILIIIITKNILKKELRNDKKI